MSFRRRRFAGSVAAVAVLFAAVNALAALHAPAEPATAASSKQLSRTAKAWRIPATTTQLIVGVADSWDSSQATLQRFVRGGKGWRAVGDPVPARLGANGLVWGRGLHPRTDDMSDKSEGDDRSPAGVFRIGRSFGYDLSWSTKTKLPYTEVTKRDLFVEDPASPLYNTYVRLDHDPATPFERKQQMTQDDPSHRLKIVIEHNSAPAPILGKGSAILFHIWRANGTKTTAGCTAMAPAAMETFMGWLDPVKQPLYVLLPVDDYAKRRASWGMPILESVTAGATTNATGTTSG